MIQNRFQSYLEEIYAAERRIYPAVYRTPLLFSKGLSDPDRHNVFLKLENEQKTGSFKFRGAMNTICWLAAQNQYKNIITASSGNHALGVAEALEKTHLQGKVVIPENTSAAKKSALGNYAIELIEHGKSCDISEAKARALARSGQDYYISPYNDIHIIGGQGTIALELLKQMEKPPAYVFVTVGGGGLVSGIGLLIKATFPETLIFGCQPENSPEMALSVQQNRYVTVPSVTTLSDGSAGAFEKGAVTFDLCKWLVDTFVLVSEKEIADAMRAVFHNERKVIEGAAGVAVAGFLKTRKALPPGDAVIILCGGNVSQTVMRDVFCIGVP